MANHKSAKKRARQTIVTTARNRHHLTRMRTAMKQLRLAIASKKTEGMDALFQKTQSVIAKARKHGIIHRNNMARKTSRLALAIQKVKES